MVHQMHAGAVDRERLSALIVRDQHPTGFNEDEGIEIDGFAPMGHQLQVSLIELDIQDSLRAIRRVEFHRKAVAPHLVEPDRPVPLLRLGKPLVVTVAYTPIAYLGLRQ